MDLRKLSALLEVDRNLIAQAATHGLRATPLLGHPSSLPLRTLKSA